MAFRSLLEVCSVHIVRSRDDLEQILDRRTAERPDTIAFCTSSDGERYFSLTYRQFSLAADQLARGYDSLASTEPRVIGIISQSGIEFALLEVALLRLGLTALLLSPNNSVPALAHLLTVTDSHHLLYHERYARQAEETKALLAKERKLELIAEVHLPLECVDWSTVKPTERHLSYDEESKRTAVIMHSSGSTGFPKTLPATHLAAAALATFHFGLCGFLTTPIYHAHGHNAFFRTIHAARPLFIFPPHLPFTSKAIRNAMKAFEQLALPSRTHFYAVPYNLKLLAEDNEAVRDLARFETVTYAGSALSDELGERLVDAGVHLVGIYGCSETGGIMTSYRDFATDRDWSYVRDTGKIADCIRWEERSQGVFEPVVLDGWPAKIKSNTPDNGYAVGDLFVKHPTRANAYKCIGRSDDTLVHINGEKTNPLPLELTLKGSSPYILEAVVFGHSRAQTGALIVPSDIGAALSAKEMLEKCWPAVEAANSDAPTHSRLLPEMLVFLPHGTAVPYADKLSILRPAVYARFKQQIDDAYQRFEAESTTKIRLSGNDLRSFIRQAVVATLGQNSSAYLTDDIDLFSLGLDSLQATRVRNLVQRDLDLGGVKLGQNVVYEHPSVNQLTDCLERVGAGDRRDGDEATAHTQMLEMVDRHASRLRIEAGTSERTTSSATIILTGTTGSLGAHLLHQLILSYSKARIACLARAKDDNDARSRVEASLRQRKLQLSSDDLARIDCYAATLSDERLGLTDRVYERLIRETTEVVHNGWTVNFNLALSSFERENIAGLVNLLNFCLSSSRSTKPTFAFSSSIGAVQASSASSISETYPVSPSSAAATGYARSKWVGEKLCEAANERFGLAVQIWRIGQLVGDRQHGVWNESEGMPLLMETASSLSSLPDLDDNLAWLPVDDAARIAVDTLCSTRTGVCHLIQPRPSPFAIVSEGLRAAGCSFDSIPVGEWLRKLEEASDEVPARKLLNFYRARYAGPPKALPTYETSLSTLSEVREVDASLVKLFVEHWRGTGFFASVSN